MITQSLDKNLGIETLNKAIEVVQAKIRELGGELVVKMKVRAKIQIQPVWLSSHLRVSLLMLVQCLVCSFFLFFFSQPRAVSETDDTELAALMERMERENAEVAGDDDEEEGGAAAGGDDDEEVDQDGLPKKKAPAPAAAKPASKKEEDEDDDEEDDDEEDDA
jgi:hypothetical protein